MADDIDVEYVERALQIATTAHLGQRDKNGAPYIFHVLSVWEATRAQGCSTATQVVALLHDVVEDTDVTLRRIKSVFGYEIADAVDAITKRRGESLDEYLVRVKSNALAWIVKAADSADNYRRLGNIADLDERARLKRKYEHVLETLRPER